MQPTYHCVKMGLSLDIGAGENPKGQINVDIRRLPGLDIICNALQLPFKEEVFSHVYLNDVFEHFTYAGSMKLLKEINRISKVGGKIDIRTPNFQAFGFIWLWLFGQINVPNEQPSRTSPPILYAPLSGLQDYNENVHLSHYTIKLLKRYVISQGFKVVKIETLGSYRGKLYTLVRLLSKIFPNRGGTIHLIATKEKSIC